MVFVFQIFMRTEEAYQRHGCHTPAVDDEEEKGDHKSVYEVLKNLVYASGEVVVWRRDFFLLKTVSDFD